MVSYDGTATASFSIDVKCLFVLAERVIRGGWNGESNSRELRMVDTSFWE